MQKYPLPLLSGALSKGIWIWGYTMYYNLHLIIHDIDNYKIATLTVVLSCTISEL